MGGEIKLGCKGLKGLDADARKVIGSDVQRVQWRWPVSKPLVDGLGGGLYEVRSTCNKVEYRVHFCVSDGSMVLLHGFIKKTQKAPKEEVALARKRMNEED